MAGKGAKKNKVLFDPFTRLCTHTITTQIGNNVGNANLNRTSSAKAKKNLASNRNSVSPLITTSTGANNNIENNNNNDEVDVSSLAAEFSDAQLTITPALPRTMVSLRVQFRLVVPLVPNDIITIYLPGFKGGAASYCTLESVANPEKVNYASCLHAYWSGCEAKHISGGKYGKKGIPPKQTITLKVVHSIIDNSLIVFAIPLSLGLISPDKLPANSFKIKIEGKNIQAAEGGKIHRQPFLTCTEIKKMNIADELAVYDAHIHELCTAAMLTPNEQVTAMEELTEYELDQLMEHTSTQVQAYPTCTPWSLLTPLFHSYEAIGGFVQVVVESAVNHIKAHDPLALYKEIARNWNVKLSAVIAFAELLQLKAGGLYRGMQINALVASRVLTMEPVDVARVFNTTNTPSTSLLRELQSALRVYSMAQDYDNTITTNNNNNNSESNANNQTEEANHNGNDIESDDMLEPKSAMLARCKSIINKWSATLIALLTASTPVEDDLSATRANITHGVNNNDEQQQQQQIENEEMTGLREKRRNGALSAQSSNNNNHNNNKESNPTHRPSVRFAINASTIGATNNLTEAYELNLNSNDGNNNIINSFDNQEESVAHAVVCPAPKSLFFGYYDISASEMEYMKSMEPETWYVLTNFTIAREDCPVDERLLQYYATRSNKLRHMNATRGKTLQTHEYYEKEETEMQDQMTNNEANINNSNNNKTTTSSSSPSKNNASAAKNYQEGMFNKSTPISPTREWLASANTVSTITTTTTTTTITTNAMSGSIPDNAILFEVCTPLECLELADLSLYPYSREWLLPFATACRVLSVNVIEAANDLIHVKMEVLGSLFGNVKLTSSIASSSAVQAISSNFPEGDRSVATLLMRKVKMDLESSALRIKAISHVIWSSHARHAKRKLYQPTMLRLQYTKQFEQIQLASIAKENVENDKVCWQVCVHPTQMLQEGVIKPATWEAIPKKIALTMELFFLSSTREHNVMNGTNTNNNNNDNNKGNAAITLDLDTFTADYGGKGPRPVRRLVEKRVVNEGKLISMSYSVLVEEVEATNKQLAELNTKLGLNGSTVVTSTMTNTTANNNNTTNKTAVRNGNTQKGKNNNATVNVNERSKEAANNKIEQTKEFTSSEGAAAGRGEGENSNVLPLSALPAGSALAAIRSKV